MDTKRLTIEFNGLKVGADIELGITLSTALRELTKIQEQIENGEFEEEDL